MAEPKYIETDDGFALLTTSTSSGGGASEVEVSNPQDIAPGIGELSAQPYSDDTGAADGSVIGILKGIYVQNVQIITLLTQIETNTNTGA